MRPSEPATSNIRWPISVSRGNILVMRCKWTSKRDCATRSSGLLLQLDLLRLASLRFSIFSCKALHLLSIRRREMAQNRAFSLHILESNVLIQSCEAVGHQAASNGELSSKPSILFRRVRGDT
jgi:hypothetical protein